MIFKSRSTSPLMEAVRETFDKFDMSRQAELRIFCGEEKAKEERIKEESVLPVARSLLLTSSPLLRFSFLTIISSPMIVFTALLLTIPTRSLLSSSPATNTISLPDASPTKVETNKQTNKQTVILAHVEEQIIFYTLSNKTSDAYNRVTKRPAYMPHPSFSFSKVSEVLKLLGSKWEEVLIDKQHIDILTR